MKAGGEKARARKTESNLSYQSVSHQPAHIRHYRSSSKLVRQRSQLRAKTSKWSQLRSKIPIGDKNDSNLQSQMSIVSHHRHQKVCGSVPQIQEVSSSETEQSSTIIKNRVPLLTEISSEKPAKRNTLNISNVHLRPDSSPHSRRHLTSGQSSFINSAMDCHAKPSPLVSIPSIVSCRSTAKRFKNGSKMRTRRNLKTSEINRMPQHLEVQDNKIV